MLDFVFNLTMRFEIVAGFYLRVRNSTLNLIREWVFKKIKPLKLCGLNICVLQIEMNTYNNKRKLLENYLSVYNCIVPC
jgi:hypothetical protein